MERFGGESLHSFHHHIRHGNVVASSFRLLTTSHARCFAEFVVPNNAKEKNMEHVCKRKQPTAGHQCIAPSVVDPIRL